MPAPYGVARRYSEREIMLWVASEGVEEYWTIEERWQPEFRYELGWLERGMEVDDIPAVGIQSHRQPMFQLKDDEAYYDVEDAEGYLLNPWHGGIDAAQGSCTTLDEWEREFFLTGGMSPAYVDLLRGDDPELIAKWELEAIERRLRRVKTQIITQPTTAGTTVTDYTGRTVSIPDDVVYEDYLRQRRERAASTRAQVLGESRYGTSRRGPSVVEVIVDSLTEVQERIMQEVLENEQ